MDDKKAAEILIKLLEKGKFAGEEREAVETAVGILSWTALAQSRLKNMGDKRKKKNEQVLKA